MDAIEVEEVGSLDVDDPVFVEGLPGVGHVGKLVAEHLVDEFDAELVRRIYSHHFPPQCTVDEDGRTELVSLEVYVCEADGRDVVIVTGDHQSQTIDGHYAIAEGLLDIAEATGAAAIYTLGGIATGELVEDYGVVGAANDDGLLQELDGYGVGFGDGEPEGGIIGVSGLLLGLGERRGLSGACLMGETSGYMVDPKSAQAVLEVLMEAVGFDVGMQELEDRAEEMEEVVKRLEDMSGEPEGMPRFAGDEDLRYIG